jgi:hypothetical protein
LVEKVCQLGWAKEQVIVIDEDLGRSGSGWVERSGFAHLTTEVAMGRAGIVLGLEVSRLARNNADWYRLFDLCGVTDTLVGDSDGVYHPALFNDRLILGLKGIMAEAELHVLRARLEGGIRNKAARGHCVEACPWALCGEKATVKFASNPMKQWSAPSTRFLRNSRNWDRSAKSGFGSAPRAFSSRCGGT